MSPDGAVPVEVATSFPRVSGDEPSSAAEAALEIGFSPRERG